jgi:hypothetical protein
MNQTKLGLANNLLSIDNILHTYIYIYVRNIYIYILKKGILYG